MVQIIQAWSRGLIVCPLFIVLFCYIDFFFFDSLTDSPSREIDPLLYSYSDYEDSVYGSLVNTWLLTVCVVLKLG